MERQHSQQMEAAEIARKILINRRKQKNGQNHNKHNLSPNDDTSITNYLTPEEIISLEETASSIAPKSMFINNKWSLERALLLHGTQDEATSVLAKHFAVTPHNAASHDIGRLIDIEKKMILTRMEKSDRIASRDLYHAYNILSKAVQNMSLPTSLFQECSNFMCQYVVKKNGFFVKGIVTREQDSDDTILNGKKKKAQEDLRRDSNKEKQIMALIAALIFVTAKKYGVGRSLKDLCLHFDSLSAQYHHHHHPNLNSHSHVLPSSANNTFAMKPKHLSKAVAELKVEFPQLFQSLANPSMDAANLVQYIGEKLKLPSAAIGCIRALALHCGKEQMETGLGAGSKPSLVCAGVTYFVCCAASVMQRLAKQALLDAEMGKTTNDTYRFYGGLDKEKSVNRKRSRSGSNLSNSSDHPSKKVALHNGNDISPEDCKSNRPILDSNVTTPKKKSDKNTTETCPDGIVTSLDLDTLDTSDTFDALTSDPHIGMEDNKDLEVLQGWFSWSNQSSWSRDLAEIGDACDVARGAVSLYYKKFLHSRRTSLLGVVQKFLTTCQDADVCYLVDIQAAAPLMILGQS